MSKCKTIIALIISFCISAAALPFPILAEGEPTEFISGISDTTFTSGTKLRSDKTDGPTVTISDGKLTMTNGAGGGQRPMRYTLPDCTYTGDGYEFNFSVKLTNAQYRESAIVFTETNNLDMKNKTGEDKNVFALFIGGEQNTEDGYVVNEPYKIAAIAGGKLQNYTSSSNEVKQILDVKNGVKAEFSQKTKDSESVNVNAKIDYIKSKAVITLTFSETTSETRVIDLPKDEENITKTLKYVTVSTGRKKSSDATLELSSLSVKSYNTSDITIDKRINTLYPYSTVEIKNDNDVVKSGESNGYGVFTAQNIPIGNYTVEVSKSGKYTKATKNITVADSLSEDIAPVIANDYYLYEDFTTSLTEDEYAFGFTNNSRTSDTTTQARIASKDGFLRFTTTQNAERPITTDLTKYKISNSSGLRISYKFTPITIDDSNPSAIVFGDIKPKAGNLDSSAAGLAAGNNLFTIYMNNTGITAIVGGSMSATENMGNLKSAISGNSVAFDTAVVSGEQLNVNANIDYENKKAEITIGSETKTVTLPDGIISQIDNLTLFPFRGTYAGNTGALQTDDLSVSAARSYTVTLHANEGTINSGNITSYTYGTAVSLPTDVTKANYSFGGWYDNEDLMGTAVTEISSDSTGDKEYWAEWNINQYTATFDLNGGNIGGSTDNVEVKADYNTTPTAPENPTKTGYTFAGWSPTLGAITADTTYTAQWIANNYTISQADTQNGTITITGDKTTANMGDEITVTVTPSTGYKLKSLTVNGTVATVENNSYTFEMPAKNIEIAAEFERKAVKSISITGPSAVTKGQTGIYTATVTAEDDTNVTELYKGNIVWSVTGAVITGTGVVNDTENGNKATLTIDENETANKVDVVAAIGDISGNIEVEVASETYYSISVGTIKGGTVTPSKSSGKANEEITFTVAPSAGYTLTADSIKVHNGEVEVTVTEYNGTYSFTMPENTVTITAAFTATQQSVSGTITGGSFKVYALDDNNAATETTTIPTDGKFIVVSTPTAADSTLTTAVSVTGATANGEAAVTGVVTGTYTVYIMGASGAIVSGEYTVNTYSISKADTQNGIIAVTGNKTIANMGEEITFTVEAVSGCHIIPGSVKVNNGDVNVTESNGTYSFTMPAKNVTISATFEVDAPVIQKYTVTITGGEGIESVKLATIEGEKSDNTYTFTEIVAGTYIFDVTYAAGYEKAELSPESITVSEIKTTETVSAQKKKFTVTFKVDDQNDVEVSDIEYNTAPTGAPSLTDTATRHYLGWVKGTDTATNVINLADERIIEDTVYTAKYETLTPQPEKIWLELLPKFKEWLQIEKITVENEVALLASKKDGSEFDESDKFSVYIAVYDGGILQSVKKVDFEDDENNTLQAIISSPDGENYKVFIWTSNYEPVTEVITSLTEGVNNLF